MSLKITLNSILNSVDGALAAVIMAYDGISIDEVAVEQAEFDLQLLAVEYAAVLKEIKLAAEVIKAGDLEEISIATSRTRIVVRVLNNDLFVALILKNDGNFGKGRYLLKLKSFELVRELS